MSDNPQVTEESVMQGTQDDRAKAAVSERDLDRFRSAYDRKIADLQTLVQRAEGRARKSEVQLRQILSQAEKGYMAKLKPEDQARYEADKARKEAMSARAQLRAAKEQERMDVKRDQLLEKYNLTGREKGLNYSGEWEDFAESAIAVAAARAVNQIRRQEGAQRVTDAIGKRQSGQDEDAAPASRPGGFTPPRVETRSSGTATISNGAPPSMDQIQEMAKELVKGSPAQRKAAAEKLEGMKKALIV